MGRDVCYGPDIDISDRMEGRAMRQVIYAMRFAGEGLPGADGMLHAATSSPSTRVTSIIRAQGVDGTIEAIDGGTARFTSDVRMTGDTSFDETGTIAFGEGNSLRFSTVGEGYIAPSPEDGLMHGVVSWRVDGGEGQFAGASGLITSNFTLSADGKVTDHHFGVLWVK
jgi:hypothetical protein